MIYLIGMIVDKVIAMHIECRIICEMYDLHITRNCIHIIDIYEE